MGEYRVMGIYPRGHVMEFVRPRLRPEVLPAAAVETAREGDTVLVAGWPVARQHPRGKSGTVFVTVEDETGDVQLILWPRVFARFRRELESRLLVAHGTVSRWDGTTNVLVSRLERLQTRAPLPSAYTTGARQPSHAFTHRRPRRCPCNSCRGARHDRVGRERCRASAQVMRPFPSPPGD